MEWRYMATISVAFAAIACGAILASNVPANAAPDTHRAYPLWDGKESVVDYARRAGIKDSELTLDLGKSVKMRLALIPAGKFKMGISDAEVEAIKKQPRNRRGETYDVSDCQPRHEVTITTPFYMGVFTVLHEEYAQVTGTDPNTHKEPRCPVENVSWDDANNFCTVLSGKIQQTVRLPTEAEWEYACRAGTTTAFNFGDEISVDQANYDGQEVPYGNGKRGIYRQKPIKAGSFKPNAWGLYDMHGNIAQWCADWYDGSYYARSPAVDPAGPSSSPIEQRVIRGGAWGFLPRDCRSSSRANQLPQKKWETTGFRIVVEMK